jgi:hypothetical protein
VDPSCATAVIAIDTELPRGSEILQILQHLTKGFESFGMQITINLTMPKKSLQSSDLWSCFNVWEFDVVLPTRNRLPRSGQPVPSDIR